MKTRTLPILLASSILCTAALAKQPATRPAAQTDVPVKTVVLFSSGVGYFEHAGTVRGDSTTELRFKTNQINDILKSLVLQDQDGGRVSTITYPSQDPLSKTLRSFQVDITSNPSMADLLNQLRGAKVTISSQAEKVSGTVVGVEKHRKPVDKGEPVEVAVLNVLTGATIRSIQLDSISSLSLDDPQLQEELNRALTALTQARDQDKKPVTINFAGQGDRRVRIGYVVETPIWKTSYRLILDDKAAKLQGWAIVENQTESDWNNVSLSLVSGRPISFVMDLYQPLYVMRPTVVQELYASLRPQVYDDAIGQRQEAGQFGVAAAGGIAPGAVAAGRGGGRGAGGAGGGGRGGGAGAPAQQGQQQLQQMAQAQTEEQRLRVAGAAVDGPTDYAASIQSVANAAKIGELFQYTVGNVTLPRQKSAMLPIVTDSIEVERLSIYNASVLPKNPLNGARVKNTTNKHLLQGPITVLDANSYAGDARIDNLPPGQERLLSYGIDLQMLVETNQKQDSNILTGKITKGMLEIQRKYVANMEYLVENKGDAVKTLIIEHPIRKDWKLVTPAKPAETTQTLYRFKDTVPTGQPKKLTVTEENVRSDTLAMLPADIGQLVFYSRTGEIPKDVRDAIGKAITFKQAMIDTQRLIEERNKQVNEIAQDQNRIRENMKTVEQKSQYYERLLAKLNEQESQIEKLQGERDDLLKKRDQQQKDLEGYLENLNVG